MEQYDDEANLASSNNCLPIDLPYVILDGMATNTLALPLKSATADLQQRIDRIYDHLYANAKVKTPDKICFEVGKILHVGMYVEETEGRSPAFDFHRSEIKMMSSAEGRQLWHQVALEIRQKFGRMNRAWKLYDDGATIVLDNFDIAYTCSQLSGIVVSDRSRDVFGDALEIFRCQWAKRMGGQFFTDQQVAHLAIALLRFDPRRGDDLVDICAGTGGFLLAGLNQIRRLLKKETDSGSIETELCSLATRSLIGQEADQAVCDVANATLISRLGKSARALVGQGDSLLLAERQNGPRARSLRPGSHLCCATNPPFGTKTTIKDPEILQQFELARLEKQDGAELPGIDEARVSPRPPDILFLEQNVRLLKPGEGRLAIVLPYQILSGPQTLFVREWLLQNTQILAVVDLPVETFQPHTGTKTALVLLKRLVKPLKDLRSHSDYPIFMSIPRWIGHDRRGLPVYHRTVDGRSTDRLLTDFPDVENAFNKFVGGKDVKGAHGGSFCITSAQIFRDPLLRMNALFHSPLEAGLSSGAGNGGKSDWRTIKVKDVVKRIFYPTRFKRNYVDYFPGAIPFLGGSNITELITTTDKWLRPDDPKLDELRVSAGWILVTRSGTTGIVATVPEAWDGFSMSEHVIRIVPDADKLPAEYLQVFLRTKFGQELLARGVFGSVIDEITPEFIGELQIPVPKLASALSSIVHQVKLAENSRQVAIENLVNAVKQLNEKLAGQ